MKSSGRTPQRLAAIDSNSAMVAIEKWGAKFGKVVPKVDPSDWLKTWKIVKGDIVQVVSGKWKGEQGKVIEVLRKDNFVRLEGINTVRKVLPKGLMGNENEEEFFLEQGIHISNVALLDPTKKVPTKVKSAFKFDPKINDFTKVRISKLTGAEIPKPEPPKRERKVGLFDTDPETVNKVTFKPSLLKSPIPKGCIL